MEHFPNIDKSVTRDGEYIGYCTDGIQRIKKTKKGWETYVPMSGIFRKVHAKTLREMSGKLKNK